MEFDQIRDYCLLKKSVTEETPFGPDALVYKVCGKMFALLSFDDEDGTIRMNLKNRPDINIELREQYSFILPGYHMNKDHWNTVVINDFTDRNLLNTLIDQSYECVVEKLPKKDKSLLI